MENKLTQEWITQFNKKCAEFLGSELKNDGQFDYWTYDHLGFDPMKIRGSSWVSGNFEFHSDWNWIMEVVEKIELFIFQEPVPDTYYEVRLVGSVYVYIGSNNGDELITVDDQPSKKQAVIQAIDQFIDWYNKQKENGK